MHLELSVIFNICVSFFFMWPMKKIMHFCKLSDNALRSKEMTNDDFFVSLFYCYWSNLARTKKNPIMKQQGGV